MRQVWSIAALLLVGSGAVWAQPVPLDDEIDLGQKAAKLEEQALALYQQGQLAQALPLAEQALALRRQLYPTERYPHGHADLARSLNNLGSLLEARRELAQAERFYRQALAMCEDL